MRHGRSGVDEAGTAPRPKQRLRPPAQGRATLLPVHREIAQQPLEPGGWWTVRTFGVREGAARKRPGFLPRATRLGRAAPNSRSRRAWETAVRPTPKMSIFAPLAEQGGDGHLVQAVGGDDLAVRQPRLVQHDAGFLGKVGQIAAVQTDALEPACPSAPALPWPRGWRWARRFPARRRCPPTACSRRDRHGRTFQRPCTRPGRTSPRSAPSSRKRGYQTSARPAPWRWNPRRRCRRRARRRRRSRCCGRGGRRNR